MSNGETTFTVIIDLFNLFSDPQGDRQERQTSRSGSGGGGRFVAGASPAAVPAPRPLPRLPGTPPPFGDFPRAPGSNDPIFRIGSFGRIFGPGAILIDVVSIIVAVTAERQLKRMGDILINQDREIDLQQARRRAAKEDAARELRAEKAAQSLERAVETFDPTPATPAAAVPQIINEPLVFPDQTPSIFQSHPIASQDPLEFPDVPVPDPFRVENPRPEIFPQPLPDPGVITLPRVIPRTAPLPNPLAVPFPLPVPLPGTGGRGQTIGFLDASAQDFPTPQTAPQTDPAKCRPRRCDDDLEDPRTECFKGLYIEGINDTDFIQWAEVDCFTGVEK